MPAILFGSISTIADTSELQRAAFNEAFAQHGLSWHWEPDEYQGLLTRADGTQRIAEYARHNGQEGVDAVAVHSTKSAAFQRKLSDGGAELRPGVAETIEEAKRNGYAVGLVTTTSPENVAALITALTPDITPSTFDVVVDVTAVDSGKPDPAAYGYALEALGESAGGCVAIEDNLDGVAAARKAGIDCVAFPNQNTAGHDFGDASATVERVDFAELQNHIPNVTEA